MASAFLFFRPSYRDVLYRALYYEWETADQEVLMLKPVLEQDFQDYSVFEEDCYIGIPRWHNLYFFLRLISSSYHPLVKKAARMNANSCMAISL
jgi:hypothetical protein